MNIAVVGSGYVGLTTALTLAFIDHTVVCLDVDEAKLAALEKGRIPFYEPHLEAMLDVVQSRISFTASYQEALAGADVVFIAVGTPSAADGSADLQYLRAAAEQIGAELQKDFTVVVNKSTVPVGSGNWVEAIVGQSYATRNGCAMSGHVGMASNPEFLREGSAVYDALFADRIVVGSDDRRAIEVLRELYAPIQSQTFKAPPFLPRPHGFSRVPLITTSLSSAELIKYAANAFLATKVSFANEIARLVDATGGDVRDIVEGIGADRRIGPGFLNAGIGWGGSCFGKDTAALVATAKEYGLEMPIVQAARQVNVEQRERVIGKLMAELKILKGRTIGLLGLAFKPNTDDLRDAPSIDIARRLLEMGAIVQGHDPQALDRARQEHGDLAIRLCRKAEQVAENADAVVLVTEWDEYGNLDWNGLAERMRCRIVIDGRNFLNRNQLELADIRHIGFGVSDNADIAYRRRRLHRHAPRRAAAQRRT